MRAPLVSTRRPVARVVVAVMLALCVGVGSACTPEPPGPSPTPQPPGSTTAAPSPSVSCTSSTTGFCTPEQAQKEQAAKKAFADAEVTFRAAIKTYYTLTTNPPAKASVAAKSFGDLLIAPALSEWSDDVVKWRTEAHRTTHGLPKISVESTTLGTGDPGSTASTVLLRVCQDSTHAGFWSTDTRTGQQYNGTAQRYQAELTKTAEGWRVSNTTGNITVKSC